MGVAGRVAVERDGKHRVNRKHAKLKRTAKPVRSIGIHSVRAQLQSSRAVRRTRLAALSAMALLSLGTLALAGACGSSSSCAAGERQTCEGPGACQGTQVCLPDGSGHDECSCPGGGGASGADGGAVGGAAGSGNAGGTSGAAGSGGSGGSAGAAGAGGSGTGGGSAGTGGGPPIACSSDLDCVGMGLLCDMALGECVECANDVHCGAGAECVDNACKPVVPCASSLDCVNAGFNEQVCDPALGRCVVCAIHSDCPTGEVCIANQCACGDLMNDPNNCGACGAVCPIVASRQVECVGGICKPYYRSCFHRDNAGFANCNEACAAVGETCSIEPSHCNGEALMACAPSSGTNATCTSKNPNWAMIRCCCSVTPATSP